MKRDFQCYYSPTAEQYSQIWKDSLVVLDTNVLLNIYRLPNSAQNELFNVLELLKERLWIPHQVALEFQRNRLSVISSERKAIEEALSATGELVGGIRRKIDALQLDKRDLNINATPFLDDLEVANNKIVEAVRRTHEAQLDISSVDPVRDRLDSLLDGKIGQGPNSQTELDELVADGEDRFKDKVPPGFADAAKDKNPADANFIFDRIKYQRKFGDLILWRQLLNHVKETGVKSVLLITADRKEDWWWREQGKTLGPHPELVREIQREAGVDIFWMYSSSQFLEHANKYSSVKVSQQSVEEVAFVARSNSYSIKNSYISETKKSFEGGSGGAVYEYGKQKLSQAECISYVAGWLLERQQNFSVNEIGFPSIVALSDSGLHGYNVNVVRQLRGVLGPNVTASVVRGFADMQKGNFSEFYVCVVVPLEEWENASSEQMTRIDMRLGRLISDYPISAVFIGTVSEGQFLLEWVVEGREENSSVDDY